MKKLYTDEYVENLLHILNDNLNDLIRWSIYNREKNAEEIDNLKTVFADTREKIETLIEKREGRDKV